MMGTKNTFPAHSNGHGLAKITPISARQIKFWVFGHFLPIDFKGYFFGLKKDILYYVFSIIRPNFRFYARIIIILDKLYDSML